MVSISGASSSESDSAVNDEKSSSSAPLLPGVMLRRARTHCGMSVEELAAKTGLSRRYLTALEEDDYDHLPGKIYISGYLRRYAALVGADADEVLEALAVSYGNYQGDESGAHMIERARARFPRDKVLLVLGAALALLVIVVLMAFRK